LSSDGSSSIVNIGGAVGACVGALLILGVTAFYLKRKSNRGPKVVFERERGPSMSDGIVLLTHNPVTTRPTSDQIERSKVDPPKNVTKIENQFVTKNGNQFVESTI
jgi:hypothetical protein